MGSAKGKGAREGLAPQTEGEISSLAPARKEATWSRKKKRKRDRHDDEDPACTESIVKRPLLAYSNVIDH
jgi:hypothetical protein